MLGETKKSWGFTLIELLVVVIIVAVLASVGIPLLTGNVERAKASEAESGLGTIRTAMRAEVAETSGVLPALAGVTPDAAGIGFNATDLDGRFFSTSAYRVTAAGGDATFCIGVDGAVGNTAPKATQVVTIARSMNEIGTIFDDASCTGTELN